MTHKDRRPPPIKSSVWLNYHHLYYFYVIAELQSVVKAAQHLSLGQPTLSTQLRQFESQLGTPLFDRKNQRLILNDTGKLVLRYAREIFGLGGELVKVVHDKSPLRRPRVVMGALDSIPKHISLQLTQRARTLGDCFVEVVEGKSEDLLNDLTGHRLDLVLANFVPTSSEASGFFSRSIGKSPIVICATPSFQKLKAKFPTSLRDAPFILPTRDSKLRHDLDHYFQLSSIQIRPVAETQDTALQKLMGVAGIGLMALPEFAIQDHLRGKQLIKLGALPGIHEEYFLIAAHRRIENPITGALIRTFKI